MKFSSKLSLGSILLLTAGLSFSGLALIGCSFAGSLHGARTALQARQTKEVHALERLILSDTGYTARRQQQQRNARPKAQLGQAGGKQIADIVSAPPPHGACHRGRAGGFKCEL